MCLCLYMYFTNLFPMRFSRVVLRHERHAQQSQKRYFFSLCLFLELDLKTRPPTPVNRLLLPNRVDLT